MQKEMAKIFMIISNWKKPFDLYETTIYLNIPSVSFAYYINTKIFEHCKG